MPFPVVPAALSIVSSGHTITVTDTTVYTAPARNALAIFVALLNQTSAGVIQHFANTFDPELASVFTFANVSPDGDQVANYWAVNYKTGAEVPVINDFVWNAPTNTLERWNGTIWVASNIGELISLAIDFSFKKHFAYNPDFLTAIARLNKLYVQGGNTNVTTKQLDILIPEATITLQGATENFNDGAFINYQAAVEGYLPVISMILNSFGS